MYNWHQLTTLLIQNSYSKEKLTATFWTDSSFRLFTCLRTCVEPQAVWARHDIFIAVGAGNIFGTVFLVSIKTIFLLIAKAFFNFVI